MRVHIWSVNSVWRLSWKDKYTTWIKTNNWTD
jgi:hypothetical protein